MAQTVIGLFDTFGQAESALRDLESLGVSENHISMVASNNNDEYVRYRDTYHGSAAGTGANTGAWVGGLSGILLGLGLLIIPGLGPLAAAGPLVAGLTGAGVGAATGGILGSLVDWGVPEEQAGYYMEGIRRGGTLLTVQPDGAISEGQIIDVMNRNGAVNINERANYYRQTGYAGYNPNTEPYTREQIDAERRRFVNTQPGYGSTTQHVGRGVEGSLPGIQTGGHDIDGTPDTRGIMEKTADALTGDRIDDKTGKPVR